MRGAEMIDIITADKKILHEGDRAFNYYDCKWGVIGEIDPRPQPDTSIGQTSDTPKDQWRAYWFDFIQDDGTRTYLDGSRIATRTPDWYKEDK